MAIRFDEKLNREIAKIVRNYNAKVRRIERLRKDYIPPRTTVTFLKSSFTSRPDLLRELKKLQSFGKRGAEDIITIKGGATTTRFDYQNTKAQLALQKRRLTLQIKRLEKTIPTVYGKEQDATYQQMGSEQLTNLKARRKRLEKMNLRKISKDEYRKAQELLERESTLLTEQALTWYNSYFDILNHSAYMLGYDQEKIDYIKQQLAKVKPEDFARMTQDEKIFNFIKDYYMIQKLKAGVLSTEDADSLRSAFDLLYNGIDEYIEMYA